MPIKTIEEKAKELDEIALTDISDRMTIEEAHKITVIWGTFLEYTNSLMSLFLMDIPESILPFPKHILVGAINKMIDYYHEIGDNDAVKSLESTRILLMQYSSDEDAITKASQTFNNEEWKRVILPKLKDKQADRIQWGFLVDGEKWILDESRKKFIEGALL